MEGAKIIVVKKGPAQKTETNVGGWFNIIEDSQPTGNYSVKVEKQGYEEVKISVSFEGEPLKVMIEISKEIDDDDDDDDDNDN